ncbi:MAG: ATP-dependent RNA helicase HrpA [Burkholderiaceae bacterium]|jgi:ATP-dependent helicase HrpA|nr:ATP-dependent RNA helicase HrpA [Burkholderiaceae bacterium]
MPIDMTVTVKPALSPSASSHEGEALPFRHPLPPIHYPDALPVSAQREDIARALRENPVIIVGGETGSGKTTQLPKICLDIGRGVRGLIGHTQPRRIAASATARRIASELGSPLGHHVGFKVRFTDRLGHGASVKLMTDGILLAETQGDPLLRQYDTLIIDEAHERSLNIDFLLGYIRQILPRRPDLKVVITSATMDASHFARYFGSDTNPAPVIDVSGRLYPVEIRYRPLVPAEATAQKPQGGDKGEQDGVSAILSAADEAMRAGQGDILVFLPGEREIRMAADRLRAHYPPHVLVLPLYARLSAQEQERVFERTNARRIILATNVAETSLTVPGVRFVIDTGLARVKRYSYRNKVEQLHIEPISQAAANQRAGRCGRVASGICIRLYDESDFLSRAPYTTPEIMRSSLAGVILRMQSLQLGDVEAFPFPDMPSSRAIADGYQLLQELGALSASRQITPLGRQLARLPLDPRIGRMILAGHEQGSLAELLVIASALSIQDPRDRPADKQEAADRAHQLFSDSRSAFLSFLKMWQWVDEAYKNRKSQRQWQEQCRARFLSPLRLREWQDIHSQLLALAHEQGWRSNQTPATSEQVHLAILTGLLGNIGCRAPSAPHYLGARGIRFFPSPGSASGKKQGRWVVAAELVETKRLYARCMAQIQPEWVERVGAHLLKKSWSAPRWEKKTAQVVASEQATLHGLVIYGQRRVCYGDIDSQVSREIFIRSALVEGEWETRLPFFSHNRRLIDEIDAMEDRLRSTAIRVDDHVIAAFYDARLPNDVCDGSCFEKWYASAAAQDPHLLFMTREDLMRHTADGVGVDFFPKSLLLSGVEMPLHYHFAPGSPRDGATLSVPLYALNQLSAESCEWLVPGMLKEKVQGLLKSLPQKWRRHCLPLKDYAGAFCERIHSQGRFARGNLLDALIADVCEQTGMTPARTDFRVETLPAHLFMNFCVTDETGRMLEMARHLDVLRESLARSARDCFQKMAAGALPDAGFPLPPTDEIRSAAPKQWTNWNFGDWQEQVPLLASPQSPRGYPALVDKETACEIVVFDDSRLAAETHYGGLRRLFSLQLKEQMKYLSRNIAHCREMEMMALSLGIQIDIREQLLLAGLNAAFMRDPLPADARSFKERLEEGKSRLGLLLNNIAGLAWQIWSEYGQAHRKIQGIKANPPAVSDMREQMGALLHARFLTENDLERLSHFPRYIRACAMRADRVQNAPERDAKLMAAWHAVAEPYWRMRKAHRQSGLADSADMCAFRWLLEELRVSLFAQELRTPMPVSVKRLGKIWEALRGQG